jgi:hypothetical protein
MRSLFFWKTWLNDYRYGLCLSGGVFAFTLIFLWFSYFRGESGVIHWEKLQEQKVIETSVHRFQLGPFELSVPGESYVILEYFHGSDITPNTTASYIFLFVMIFSAIVMLTIITTLGKFSYYVGMGIFMLFLVSLRIEVLGIFGLHGQVPVITVLIVYVLPGFYFNRFRPSVPYASRFMVFLGITALIGLSINYFSSVALPFYHLTLTGYVPGLIVTILFIITVAHEVFASFVYMVSQGSTKSLRHLSLICVIYLSNLIITCFHEMGIIQWNFVYINLYLLLTISAILGIWGFRQREVLYENILPFAPFGAYFFLALASISFATTAQLLVNGNDPALKVIRDVIIFTHTGYGIIFLTYIFSNFVLMLARNLPVYKVLYNPTRMPYFTYRFAGLIATLAFIFYSNWRDYVFNGVAAFHNTAGDLYTMLGNDAYAESFYEQGQSQGFQNNRSNYALATLKSSRFNVEAAHKDYERANSKRPTPYSLVNAGNLYIWENNIPEAIRQYQRSYKQFTDLSVLEINLGFAYAKVRNLDSALVYLNKARENSRTRISAETNFFALAALELIPLKIDSIIGLFNNSSPAMIGNALALSTLQEQELKTALQPLAEKSLNLYTATQLNNYCIKYAKSVDTTFTNQAYAIASDSNNSDYSEALKASLAFAFYHQGNVTRALQILAELAYISQSHHGKFNYIMGLWALEQQNPELAASCFTFADTYDYKEARFYHAIALSEAGRIGEALVAWDSLALWTTGEQQAIAIQMRKILSLPASEAPSLGDAEKYQFCRYRIGLRDSLAFNRIVNTFEEVNYKAQALLELSQKYYEADLLPPGIHYFNRIAGLELSEKKLYDDIRFTELRMLAYRGDVSNIARQINKGVTFGASRELDKLLYAAMLAEASGDSLTANTNYRIVSTYNPYFEEGIIASSHFYRKQKNRGFKAYNILAEAIQINANSIRLLKAYANEAARQGFDEYAANARQRIIDLEASLF